MSVVQTALQLHTICEPYVVDALDDLERRSLIASIFSLLAGLFFYARVNGTKGTVDDVNDDVASLACACLIVAINLFVFMNFLNFIRQEVLETYQDKHSKEEVAKVLQSKKVLRVSVFLTKVKRKVAERRSGAQVKQLQSVATSGAERASQIPDNDEQGGVDNEGAGGLPQLPVEFFEKQSQLVEGVQKVNGIYDHLQFLTENLGGFESQIDAVRKWTGRLQVAVEWKQRQAEAVVRQHSQELEQAQTRRAHESVQAQVELDQALVEGAEVVPTMIQDLEEEEEEAGDPRKGT
jgi:hypothetical protein